MSLPDDVAEVVLRRDGLMRRPFYHILVERDTGGAHELIEKLGVYNPMLPHAHPDRLILRKRRLDHWRSQGVRLSPAARKILEPS